MEDRDLKSAVRQIKEKKKRETLERLIIFLSGLLITLVFIAIGLNFYTSSDKTISEPQVKVLSEVNKPPAPPQPQQLQTTPPVQSEPLQQPTINQPQPSTTQPEVVKENQKQTQTTQNLPQNQQLTSQPERQNAVVKQPQPSKTVEEQNKEVKKEENKEHQQKQETKRQEVAKKEENNQQKQKIEQKEKPVQQKVVSEKEKETSAKEVIEKLKSGYFAIQVGAFSTKEKAEIEKAKYSNAYIIEEGGLHKVLVGKFNTEKEARDYQKQHDIKGFIKRVGS
ncbi:SPOR domain-containing protein [Sulfurihydrogenibium sp.]|uniref:SPOR domain-containing protein n=1 Tax=Sulfurihydrogenibium sp. TaxID=2053621 RepID=UPI002603E898|nr:SPOR domain-containing protein [Sulfurihydrogenibium sp.]